MCACVHVCMCACVHVCMYPLNGALVCLCRRCIMAGSIRESARVTQQITAAWSQPEKRRWEDSGETYLHSATLTPADRDVVGEISFTAFKALSSLWMIYFEHLSYLIRKTNICEHEVLLQSWQLKDEDPAQRLPQDRLQLQTAVMHPPMRIESGTLLQLNCNQAMSLSVKGLCGRAVSRCSWCCLVTV